ncbi:Fe-S cluster assembly ATPase SufC [Clostridium luticellarii]|jgi:Fe-S cluster assembly ATP-binding protein|uniref:Vegetative protein 296 n=1 Tax=Clostridium luticellarii TaxID=1691940 RepID=A0A2T0BBG0_9CLOT|nr:Fe-S cluster assembly ATPase SufC [Clostridium luticellarii]MCI1944816.1 Fe-S cluster assembly ATPase SufC [Clostridium luticellarii]MCI1968368.1 Fe-S cluster assembly ATPase SufC [Clostridium luticellarii]MCI1995366.1 Fe-S cluster assembly ATPase SufC [Clostridium luticellarii]MCI2039372.1 Fe-S cluster assembly ATPase SufC [Clostridium luticellarii]PRR81214.1 Vegetative protein 296 [Clostridium luticellarii]
MGKKLLTINNLRTKVEDKEILKGLNLEIEAGEIHAIMGPNGAGKSTLVNTIMGHPNYAISGGDIVFEGEKINDLKVDERARRGIFMSFQYPQEIQGITVENFLRSAKAAVTGERSGILAFRRLLKEKLKLLKIDESYAKRYLNVGFSGGEKKKNEILQMAVLQPKLAMLDETDSGLDVDAVRIVSEGVSKFRTEDNSILVITHHNSILENLKPDYVHILVDGRIVKTGDASLAEEIEKNGYDKFKALV